ncbi:hypothetical protein [Streptomyces sp. NPDC057428]|uniref:hypothetical protein n=1 Tax=Streptomyces sp. NPDC057428 TaxID=3346129 RepID=UPI0036AAD0A1
MSGDGRRRGVIQLPGGVAPVESERRTVREPVPRTHTVELDRAYGFGFEWVHGVKPPL